MGIMGIMGIGMGERVLARRSIQASLCGLLALSAAAATGCAGTPPTASGPPVQREYLWNDSEHRACKRPPLAAEALQVKVQKVQRWRASPGRDAEGKKIPDVFAYLIPRIQACMPWAKRAAQLPYGTVHVAFSIDCEGRVSAIRAITDDIEATTVQCVLTQFTKARFDPPKRGLSVGNLSVVLAKSS